jgi:hypothetical protein
MPGSPRPLRTAAALGLVAAMGLAFVPAPASPAVLDVAVDTTLDNLDAVTDLVSDADAFAPQLVTVDTPTPAAKSRLHALGLDLTEHAGRDYVEVVLHSLEDVALLTANGFTWDVRIADMLAREVERIALDEAYAARVEVSELPSGRTGYRVLDDFEAEIDALVARFPDLAKRISIGGSVEGRDLTGIEIGRDVHAPEDGRPVFLMFGAHHAREWPSAELPMEFAYDLLEGYGTHPRITDLLDRGRAVIVPVSNPDGYDASRTSGDIVDLRELDGGGTASILATPGNAYKRKNCRFVDGQTQPAGTCVLPPSPGGLGLGIDLNRNYGALWGGPGASGDPTSAIYRGPAPFSEPETQAIRDLISNRQVTTLITNHTFSNLILRPVGVHPDTIGPDGNPVGFAPDECFTADDGRDLGMQTLGERMAAHTGYSNQFGWELYDTTGTTEDYSYNATGGYGYTFEIGPNEFHPPFEEVVAEYTGDNAAARSVTPDNAHELTTEAADDCDGDPHDHDHDGVGGGNREAFLVAFENAVDAATHSVIRGTAPAGATLTVERTGVFPLWDRSMVADTVATAMVVGEDGAFEYHVNPSTRPFVQSRKAPLLGEPKETYEESGFVAPLSSSSTTFEVTEPADLVRATIRTAVPVDGQVVSYAQFHLRLVDPQGDTVAEATEFGPINSLSWSGPDGDGIPTGTYTLEISNSIAVTSAYELEAATQDVVSDHTARRFEQWTLSCLTADGLVGEAGVSVERGQTVDVGDVCNTGVGADDGPPRKPKKDHPGKGNGGRSDGS